MIDRQRQLLRMLAISEHAREQGAESIGEASAGLPADAKPQRPGDLIDQVATNLDRLAGKACDDPAHDPVQWQKARDLLLAHAGPALARAVAGEAVSRGSLIGAEAVIIADGTRPSFLLCGGEVSADDPFLGRWGGDVATARAAGLRRLAGAVGRIQPQNGHASRFIGTGSLIARDPADGTGLILTNKHVIDEARSVFGIRMTQQADRLTVEDPLEIDFIGEACSLDRNVFNIVEVLFPPGAGAIFAGIDAAVARIAPGPASQAMPAPVPLLSADAAYANGGMTSLATIGFPAAPQYQDDGVDWNFVLGTLFGHKFGLKRLAPGLFTEALGSHPQDVHRLAIGHDATTFGGASGSLVCAWLNDRTPGFALHFGGQTEVNNYAVAFAAVKAALKSVGVPF